MPGPIVVKERQYERTNPDVLERYGGGDIWPPAAAWDLGERMSNNNFYESDEMAVSHGICGDTPQVLYSYRITVLGICLAVCTTARRA